MPYRQPLVGALLTLALTACGCGGGDDTSPGATTSSPSNATVSSVASSSVASAADVPRSDVETTTADCAIAPKIAYADLPAIEALPDPFRRMDGSRIDSVSDWRCQRAETSAQLQRWIYGQKPGPGAEVSAETGEDNLTVSVFEHGERIDFTATIEWPTTGTPPYPALIGIDRPFLNNQQLLDQGIALIHFPNDAIAAQAGHHSRGEGAFYDLYGADHSAASTVAWAWGVSRLIDALEKTDKLAIDPERLGVTGCSRNGKGALVTGALDERIALTIVQESGSGGSAAWRVSDAQLAAGQKVQTARQIVTENTWLREDFEQFAESVTRLPVDNHELLGLVAPRALLVLENTGMEWLGNESAWTSALAAREVYHALGVPDHMGVTQIGGHRHCVVPDAQKPAINAFVQRFLLGQQADTDIVETDAGYTADRERWMPWSTPELTTDP